MAHLKRRKLRPRRRWNPWKLSRGCREEQVLGTIAPSVAKYWRQRHSLFSRYDDGILMDEEGWFSVTPEAIAAVHASRAAAADSRRGGGRPIVLDCFAGVGGNAIQFALSGCHVIAIDIDPVKIQLAVHNAKIYGVDDQIDFIVGDFFQLAPMLKGDILFLSPPWGGPSYAQINNYTLDFLRPRDGYTVFQFAQKITPNIIMFLPRNVDVNQVEELSWLSSPPLSFKIEENRVRTRVKAITAYFGDILSGTHQVSNLT